MDGKVSGSPARVWLAVLACATTCTVFAAEPKVAAAGRGLLDVGKVLEQIEVAPTAPGTAATVAPPQQLLNDIVEFRAQTATLDAKRAATTWFDLYDRAKALSLAQWTQDYRLYDPDIHRGVTTASVLYSLPPPAAWPAMREVAQARAARAPKDSAAIAARLMTELLLRDRVAAEISLKEIETLAASRAPEERPAMLDPVHATRWELATLYGTPEEIAATFIDQHIANVAAGSSEQLLDVPDLVGLVGAARATELLRKIITGPSTLNDVSGDATRALARKVALDHVDEMRIAQWSLIDSIEAASLYEALQRRFDVGAASVAAEPTSYLARIARSTADVYYLLAMIIAGKQGSAESTLLKLARDEPFAISKEAVAALEKAGQQEALFRFLHQTLRKHPELRAWSVYIEQAAYTGHASDALALIDELLARKDLPEFVHTELRTYRIDALLARDDVEPATRLLRESLKSAPTAADEDVDAQVARAVRLVRLGRVLSKPELANSGLLYLHEVLALPVGENADPADMRHRLTALDAVLDEERKLGRNADAQADAIAELRNRGNLGNDYQQLAVRVLPWTRMLALTELASLYGSSGRDVDVVKLLDESTQWGGRDLEPFRAAKDSQDVPLFLIAARSLAATGNKAAALSLVKALLAMQPGYDPAYELLVRIDPNALQTLDTLAKEDAFEERPLIWTAVVLKEQGQLDPALATIRRALAIDPSDGEEGKNDRMRGYAVLADILAAKGDTNTAAELRKAVTAIRISERSDELHELGLYQRAFAGYREALTHFQDAYCIQSRLAVQLTQQGRRSEALEHYRRAYELMPASFGRVESHCFGCESVFQGTEQQGIAAEVFTSIVAKTPDSPQAHYLFGYLREEQHRYGDALEAYRRAVALDKDYLNAWKHLDQLGEHIYIEPSERDIARLRLLELDPRQRHVQYDLSETSNLTALWRVVDKAGARQLPPSDGLYPLRASAKFYDDTLTRLPADIQAQFAMYQSAYKAALADSRIPTPRATLASHTLLTPALMLMGIEVESSYD